MISLEKQALIKKCRAFWHLEEVDKPIFGILVNRIQPLKHFSIFREDAKLEAKDLTVEAFITECERRHSANKITGGDTPYVAYPWAGLPWLEGIMDLPIKFDGAHAWMEKYTEDWRDYTENDIQWNNGWFDKILEFTQAAIDNSKQRYPVGPCHFHGPIDIASAMLGAENFALASYDAPDELQNLLDIIKNIWLKVVDEIYKILPKDNGGYWNGNQPLWTPGKNMFVPADAVSMLSPDTVEKFVVPTLRQITKHMDYCIAHTHSTYLHTIDKILDIDGFQCIQVGMDVNGPPIENIIPVMKKIQQRKALIVAICQEKLDEALEQVQKSFNELDPAGLCILVYLETAEKGLEFMNKVKNIA